MPLELPSTYDRQHIKPPTYTKRIILSIDHMGIRRLQFLERDSKPLSDGAPWYEFLETTDSDVDASISWDGLFVRKISVFAAALESTRKIWSSPELPNLNPWNIHNVHGNRRLNHVKLDAKVRGLIVCCSRGNAIGIYGFTGISKAFESFVELMNQRAQNSQTYWFYFPINNGELITAAWIRKFKDCNLLAWPPALAAPLEGLYKVRVCRDLEKPHRPCIGLLLYYTKERVESLGQVRWDRDLTYDVLARINLEIGNINGKDYIKGVQRDTACTQLDSEVGVWQKIPQHGTLVWWFGNLGDKVALYNDPVS
ncbi:hypothetical protein AFLA70_341g001221 [Aspergillus flavus AF70]|nr:hypothetical protein AFLA70_341g001221 [Aspergillus flavus AF70]